MVSLLSYRAVGPALDQPPFFFREKFQPALDRLDHRARRDGGAGELVEHAAVLFHGEFLRRWVAKVFTLEAVNPVSFGRFDLVAQTGGFRMLDDSHAEQTAVLVDAHHADDATGIALADHLEHHGFDLAGAARTVDRDFAIRAGQEHGVLEQIIVELAGQHLAQRLLQVKCFRCGNGRPGGTRGDGQGGGGDQRGNRQQSALITKFVAQAVEIHRVPSLAGFKATPLRSRP
jgi:hypothetical protein